MKKRVWTRLNSITLQIELYEGVQLHQRLRQPHHLEEVRRTHAKVRAGVPQQVRDVVPRVHVPHQQDGTRTLRHDIPYSTFGPSGRVPLLQRAATHVSFFN